MEGSTTRCFNIFNIIEYKSDNYMYTLWFHFTHTLDKTRSHSSRQSNTDIVVLIGAVLSTMVPSASLRPQYVNLVFQSQLIRINLGIIMTLLIVTLKKESIVGHSFNKIKGKK